MRRSYGAENVYRALVLAYKDKRGRHERETYVSTEICNERANGRHLRGAA